MDMDKSTLAHITIIIPCNIETIGVIHKVRAIAFPMIFRQLTKLFINKTRDFLKFWGNCPQSGIAFFFKFSPGIA